MGTNEAGGAAGAPFEGSFFVELELRVFRVCSSAIVFVVAQGLSGGL